MQDLIPTTRLPRATLAEALSFFNDVSKGRIQAIHTSQSTNNTIRETSEIGFSYHKMMRDIKSDPTPIPRFLIGLYTVARKNILIHHPHLIVPAEFNNCIISVFNEGSRLQSHIDNNHFKTHDSDGRPVQFYYDDTVLGIVLCADTKGRLYFQPQGSGLNAHPQKASFLKEENGMIYLLQGKMRHGLDHGVSPVKNRRVSLTFRRMIQRAPVI